MQRELLYAVLPQEFTFTPSSAEPRRGILSWPITLGDPGNIEEFDFQRGSRSLQHRDVGMLRTVWTRAHLAVRASHQTPERYEIAVEVLD